MTQLKIIMLNYEFPPIGGGAGKAQYNILKELSNFKNLKIDVLTSGLNKGFTEEQFADNIKICKVGIRKKNLHYWKRTEVLKWLFKANSHHKRLVRENNYDIAHAFFGFPTALLCCLKAKKLPYIISLRGSDVPGSNPRLKLDYKIMSPLFKLIWKNSSQLIACSKGLKQRALKFFPEANIDVIPNGVNTSEFKPPLKKPKRDDPRLLTVGRLSSGKRVDVLIRAFEMVLKEFKTARLTIAGDGNLMAELKWLPVQLGISDKVGFAGIVPGSQMPEFYQQSDIFISASLQEGMSNAMLEAMACGLPIITTRCEGTEELIKDNGIIIDDSDFEKFAKEIIQLLNHRKKYEQMSKAARNQAALFSWRTVAEQYIEYYEKIANKS